MRIILLVTVAIAMGLYSTNTYAQNLVRKDLGFLQKDLRLSADEVYSASALITEEEWRQSREDIILRPFADYRSLKNYNPVDGSENLEVFRSEAAFLSDRFLVESFFNANTALEILQIMDVGFVHSQVPSDQVNQTYQEDLASDYQSAMETLDLRRTRSVNPLSQDDYQQAVLALEAQWTNNQTSTWCETPEVNCILSQVSFDKNWESLIQTISALPLQSFVDIPSTIEHFAEIYLINDPALASQSHATQSLNIPANRVLVLNGFLANTLIQFTKMVVSVHSYSDSQSLIVIQSAIALEKDDLDKVQTSFIDARTVLMGRSIYNRDEGFSMGLPRMQETIAIKLKEAITRR